MGLDARTMEDPPRSGDQVGAVCLRLSKNKIDSEDEEHESHKVVPSQRLILEERKAKDHEHGKRDHFLNYLQLDERERSAVFAESNPVGWDLEHVFEECDAPTDEYD